MQEAIAGGLCGCTIQDTTADPNAPLHDFDATAARIRAAVAARREAPHFVLTARAENFLHGRPDLDDTVRRLVAFAEVGADCLYAPGLPDLGAVRRVVQAVAPKPVNVLFGPCDALVPLAMLKELGVRRVSVGGAIARAAYGAAVAFGQAFAARDLPGAMQDVPAHAALNDVMRR